MPSGERRTRLDGRGRFNVALITFELYVLAFPILLFHILLLIGCATDSPAICAPSRTGRTCGPSVGKSALILTQTYNLTSPQETLQYALDLQTSISFVIPTISALLFLFAIISFIAARGITKRNGTNTRSHINSITFLFWSSTASAFAAAYALTSAGAALSIQSRYPEGHNPGMDIGVEQGKVMLALQWMTWGFTMIAACMSGSIMRTFLKGGETRRRTSSSSGSSYTRGLSMPRHDRSHAPPY